MATTFKNVIASAVPATNTIVYTAANNVKVTVIGISLTNLTSGFTTASIIITDPAPAGTFTANQSSVTNPTILTNVNTFVNIAIGAALSGTGIPSNTTITGFDAVAKTITMNNSATQTLTANTVSFVSTTPASSYFVKDAIIPANQSFRAVNGGERLVIGSSNQLSIVSSVAGSLDAIISLVEIV
jgi:hypothetical protein